MFWTGLWMNTLGWDQQGAGVGNFLILFDVACINVFLLLVLNSPNWQQRRNLRRPLCELSLGEEMVRPHIRRRADSGNIDRHTRRAMRAVDVPCTQLARPATVKKDRGRWRGRCSGCTTAKDRRADWKYCRCSEWVCKNHSVKTVQTKCDNWQEQS